MLCPYCLENTNKALKCQYCDESLPALYLNAYRRFNMPVVLSAVGFSGHGKTVYLAALLHVLTNQLTRVWKGFYRQGLDQNAINTVRDNLRMLEQGDLPESTRRNFPRPSIHKLARMPKFNERQIVIYDPPGEAFEEGQAIEEFASFVSRAKTVMFLISLTDLEDPLPSEIHRLLEVYTLGMSRLKAKTKKQNLVVVYTKADLLLGERFFGNRPGIVDYLQRNDLLEINDLRNYQTNMNRLSYELAEFTLDDLGAHSFVHLAKDAFRSVSYCATSALGSPPEDGKLSEAMQPRRVVDPLLWVLEKA